MMRGSVVLIGAVLAVGPGAGRTPLAAHHSIAGVYDSSQPVRIEGVVAQFHFVNPHPYVIVDVAGADGRPESWRLEMDNRFELADIGMTASTLRPGDRVTATGSRGRTQPHSLYVRRLDRPADGFRYEQIGASPRVQGLR